MEFTIHSKMWSQKQKQKIISAHPPLTQWENARAELEELLTAAAFLAALPAPPTIGIVVVLLRRYFQLQLRPF